MSNKINRSLFSFQDNPSCSKGTPTLERFPFVLISSPIDCSFIERNAFLEVKSFDLQKAQGGWGLMVAY